MIEQHARPTIHIGERNFRLAVLGEHPGRYFRHLLYEPEKGVFCYVGPGGGEGEEGGEAWVGAPEDGVPVAGDYAPGMQGGPEVGGNV